jgi:hypothetical protein
MEMGLNFSADWKFDGVGFEIPNSALSEFEDLVQLIATGVQNPQDIYETFKSAFGNQSTSSDASWAVSDLQRTMASAKGNAATFVDSFWQANEELRNRGISVPSQSRINSVLKKHQIPLVIDPPELRMPGGDAAFCASSQAGIKSASDQSVFTKHEVIGRGGFGVVYRVTKTTSVGDFDFAMKILSPSTFMENKERCFERFKREVRILRDLQHRCIVAHLEAGVDEERRPYILMPLIKGKDLRDATSGQDSPVVVGLFREVLIGVEYAHSKEILHRDLKPSNILVRESDDQPIILDFGCGYLMDDANTQMLTTTLVGSAPYIPPEVHKDPNRRSKLQDVFACGVTLYEILARELPDISDYHPIEKIVSDIKGVDAVIRDAIGPEKSRIKTMSDFIARLDEITFLG